MKRGFTLIELLVVMAIMGLLGTVSVGGYRAMQRGMEERGVMQNVNAFVRAAYQRAQIDRTPVKVYFWNETLREESDTESLVVVGKAVAVRQTGRFSRVENGYLYDEFGDLRFLRLVLDEGDADEAEDSNSGSTKEGNGMAVYRMTGRSTSPERCLVSQTTRKMSEKVYVSPGETRTVEAYAFAVIDPGSVTWQTGDAYGFEFATLELPHNYIFGSSYSRSVSSPVSAPSVIVFRAGRNSGSGATGGTSGASTVRVSSLRPGRDGSLSAETVATSDEPTRRLK